MFIFNRCSHVPPFLNFSKHLKVESFVSQEKARAFRCVGAAYSAYCSTAENDTPSFKKKQMSGRLMHHVLPKSQGLYSSPSHDASLPLCVSVEAQMLV